MKSLSWIPENLCFGMRIRGNLQIHRKDRIEDMVNDNYKDFFKAIISIEKGVNDESVLDKLYDAYMDNDSHNLLHEEFDYMIEKLRE